MNSIYRITHGRDVNAYSDLKLIVFQTPTIDKNNNIYYIIKSL